MNLVDGGTAAEAEDHELDQFEMMQGRHLAQAFQVGGFLGKNVIAGDGLKRLGGEAQVHGVACLRLEVDGEACEDCIHGLDLAEPPAAMRAIAALGEEHERLDVCAVDLSCGGQFIELFSHKIALNSRL